MTNAENAEEAVLNSIFTITEEVTSGDSYISGSVSIASVIANALEFLTGLLGVIALAVLVWAGFRYMAAAGSDAQIASAKKTAFWAVAGLVIAATAFVILQFVQDIFL